MIDQEDKAALEITLTVNLEKCIKLFAQNARKNAKCLSNQAKILRENQDQFSAKNVMQRKSQEDIS